MFHGIKRFRIFLLTLTLSITGCTINQDFTLNKRLSYESEREIKLRLVESNKIVVKGAPENNQIINTRRNNGFVGSGRSYNYDVGLTFNQKLEQSSALIEAGCMSDCAEVVVLLVNPNMQYKFGLDSMEYSIFTTDVEALFPQKCNLSGPQTLSYSKRIDIASGQVLSVSYSPFIIPIELTVIALIEDLQKIYNENCTA